MTIGELVQKHKLHARYVGGAPTYEVTGLSTKELEFDLKVNSIGFNRFVSNNKDHEDFGKLCVEFTWFGEIDKPNENNVWRFTFKEKGKN